jgi:pre-rRNA-processing protein IPI1
MGKSTKAKKEKAKDFQKAKLKVGKTKPKATNLTDTSFKARSIAVLHQSLNEVAPSSSSQFTHHLNLLSHKSEGQRKESLGFLVNFLQGVEHTSTLPLPASSIFAKVQPLLLDASKLVRTQTLQLLSAFPESDVQANVEVLLLYSRTALTHLSAKIQLTGLDALEWLLNTAGQQLVSSPGGWLQTLGALLIVLGWKGRSNPKNEKGWTQSGITARTTKNDDDEKMRIRQLQVLGLLLETALGQKKPKSEDAWRERVKEDWTCMFQQFYTIPQQRNPYGYLNLFGGNRDEENGQYQDQEERIKVFKGERYGDVLLGVSKFKGYGGGTGRATMGVERILQSVQVEEE